MGSLIGPLEQDVASLIRAVKATPNLEDVVEVRARIEAARAWAKVHKQTKNHRLDLLFLEVEALLRTYQLGGCEYLSASEQEFAEHLGRLTDDERSAWVAAQAAHTTAAGMWRAFKRDGKAAEKNRAEIEDWRRHAQGRGARYSAESLKYAVQVANSTMRAHMEQILIDITEVGQEFTVAEVADALLLQVAPGYSTGSDPTVVAGVKEVVRSAIRRAIPAEWDGEKLPKYVTAYREDSEGEPHYFHVPTMSAALWQLEHMVNIRREQLDEDARKLAALERLHSKLRSRAASDDAIIGDLVLGAAQQAAA